MQPLQHDDPGWIGRYRLEARLGAGGMGRVYLGQTPEGRYAAVKVIRDELAEDTGFRHRFHREVSAALSVAGMFTARVLDADPDADPPWLATEYVDGPSLREAVHRSGPLAEDALIQLAQGLAGAVGSIHAAGLVHRDLKPANVMLSPTGPKVIDFGIARSAEGTHLTGTGETIGTPEYMAPEQLAGTAPGGPPIDVFALGSTLGFAATGRGPFAADRTAAVLFRIMELEPDLSAVPPALHGLVRACLAKAPQRRPTAQQIAVALRPGGPGPAVFDGAPAGPPPGPLPDDRPTTTLAPVPAAPPGPVGGVTGPDGGRWTQRGAEQGPDPRAGRRWRLVPVTTLAAAAVALAAATVGSLSPGPPAGGTDVIQEAGPAPGPPVDPDNPQAVYMDRMCASGDLVGSLAAAAVLPPPALDDPARARRDFLASLDRAVSVSEVVVADFSVLRDDAPDAAVGRLMGRIVDEFTGARESFAGARDTVRAADPLTAEDYTTAIGGFTAGTRAIVRATSLVEELELPDDYRRAVQAAPHCTD